MHKQKQLIFLNHQYIFSLRLFFLPNLNDFTKII